MKPVHLLLVEDDAVSRGFLTLALQSMPATVVDVVTHGAHAVGLVRESEHALWLLDANLPDTSGERLLATLRELRPGIPALCLTAETALGRLDSLRAAGFAEVAPKPLTIAMLHAAVRRALTSPDPSIAATVWDDAMALRALGGNAAAVAAMRGLFIAELPAQAAAISRAIMTRQFEAAHAELHKLKASCGFVGCPRLLHAIHALSAAPEDRERLQHFHEQAHAALSGA